MQPYLIDTHAHIYLNNFDNDRQALLGRAQEAGVSKILLPAIDSESHETMLELEADIPYCHAMMGLHPCSVKENFEEELRIVKKYTETRPFIAIGEIGLDFYWDTSFTDQQYTAFRQQIEWAMELDLPIVIHSRNAIDECIEVVAEYTGIRGVFHCFSGTAEQAKKIIDLNFYLGIGGVLTYKNSGLDQVLSGVSLEHLVLETDAPYLSPVPYRGKRNEPAYTRIVAEKLAEVCGHRFSEVVSITSSNAEKLFSIGANA